MNNKTDTPNKIHLAIYKMYLYLIEQVRSNKRLHQFIFKYRPCKVRGGYWDWTTLILKKALRNYLKPDDVFLDMGTGSVGVLAIYASLGIGCK